MIRADCTCREAEIIESDAHGRIISRRPTPRVHDCDYVRAREALIPVAERVARAQAHPNSPAWTTAFMAAMDSLWRETSRER